MAEEYALLTKMARRCAYDLGHAVDDMRPGHMQEILKDAPAMWLNIFSPDGVKDYRHDLYRSIDKLNSRIKHLREFCKANGLDPEEVDETMPF